MRFSTLVGWDLRWNDITIATLTTAMYTLNRSHERNVLSFAQWSRASEDSFGKRIAPKKGRARNGWEVEELVVLPMISTNKILENCEPY